MKILYLNYSNSTVQLMRISDVARGLRLQDHQVDLIHMDRNVQAQLRRAQKQSTDAYATTKKHLSFSRFLPRFLAVLAGEPKRFYYNLRMFFDELRILRKSDHDFVLVRPGICWSIFVSTYLLKKKVVYDTDGPLLEAYQSPNCNLPKHYLKMEGFWVRQWKAMSVISNEMKRFYQAKGGDPNRIFTMPNGINSEIFHPEVDASEIKKRYKLEDKLVIGFMGNLEFWHGLPGLLQVFPHLAERYENLRMLLVGFHLDWDNLAESADKRFLKYKDRVICTGRIPFDLMPKHLKAIDIFILPYQKLDFFYFSPVKLFESMGVGCAVVAADIGQIPEVVEDGKDGLLFPPGEYQEMTKRIELLINDPELRKEMGEVAAKKIRNNYLWELTTKSIIDAYNYTYGDTKG